MGSRDQRMSRTRQVLEEVAGELDEAITKYPPFNSANEGYAVILEELDELWEEVRKPPTQVNLMMMRKEAIQVAAMAARMVTDVTDH